MLAALEVAARYLIIDSSIGGARAAGWCEREDLVRSRAISGDLRVFR